MKEYIKIFHEKCSDYILYFLHIVGEIGSEVKSGVSKVT